MNDFKFEFGRHQINKIPREKIIVELEKVAKHFNYTDFKQDDFDKMADINYYTVYREFGPWKNVMEFLADHFKSKGIDFKITTRRSSHTVQEMFDEMERICMQLGHRPSRNEWTFLKPKICYDSIYRRFGGRTKACLKFIEYKSGGVISAGDEQREEIGKEIESTPNEARKAKSAGKQKIIEKTRTISLNIRVRVLSRDNFRCVFCGKSPATDIGTKLHIDHIVLFSKGGTNSSENLQTLCEQCNLGKSNTEIE